MKIKEWLSENYYTVLAGLVIMFLIIGFSTILFGMYLLEKQTNEINQICGQLEECEVYSCKAREYLKVDFNDDAIKYDKSYELCKKYRVTQ